jgi:hypothetical protein
MTAPDGPERQTKEEKGEAMTRLGRTIGLTLVALVLATTAAVLRPSAAFAGVPMASTPGEGTSQTGHGGTVSPNLAPGGCNSGNFCSYNKGNGGDLCFQTNVNVPYWSENCANHNQSAYNRNINSINLYYGGDYWDAYSVLGSGNYWLYMDNNYFNRCGTDCYGLNEPMGYNVASSKFNAP